MNKSIRKTRFDNLSRKRLDRALDAIGSIENLANKANYDYNLAEVNDLAGRLMAKVKLVMSAFGSGSPEDRFNKLIQQDQLQYDLLKVSDPEVHAIVTSRLNDSSFKMKETLEPTEAEIVTQFKNLYDQLTNTEQSVLKNKSVMTKNIHSPDDFFLLDPRFDLSRLRAPHNINRLIWLGAQGKTYQEILSPGSPYYLPDDAPITNLHWDIREGRVLQDPKNKLLK